MRRIHALLCLVTALLLGCAFTVLAVPANAAGIEVRYVALGDSYSSGVGTGQVDPASGGCARSPLAYPVLWNAAHRTASFAFGACSGATTQDVLSTQLGTLDRATTLVTISVGGNDVGFAHVVTTCTLGTDRRCADVVETARAAVRADLPPALDRTYAAIRRAAPVARVIVLGYPRLFELTPSCWRAVDVNKRTMLDEAADLLSAVISERAKAAGFTYLDVRPMFAGHGICAAVPWINGVTWPITDSYHPSRAGHASGYLAALDGVTDRD